MTLSFVETKFLAAAYGLPMEGPVPTKLGFKNPTYVISMEVTNDYSCGFWKTRDIISCQRELKKAKWRVANVE